MNHTYLPGQWNVHCDVCGFKFKSSEIRKRWDGLMVCKDDFELDHPQKYLRVPQEDISVPFVRRQPDTVDISPTCTFRTRTCRADYGTADCMTVGFIPSIETIIDIYGLETTSVADIAIADVAIAEVEFIL